MAQDYDGYERRSPAQPDEWREETTLRLSALESAVAKNTAITSSIKQNTDDIVEFFEAGRGTFKVLRMIGTAAKWVTTVSAAIAVTWLTWKGGNK